jgi:hypothetical protein
MSSTSRSPSASSGPTRRRLGLAVALGCLIALTSSCRQIVGIGSGGRSADGGDAADGGDDAASATLVGGLPIGGATAACAPCVMLKCLDAATACAADLGCAYLDPCLWSCAEGDLPCAENCSGDPAWQSPQTVARLAALRSCIGKWCSAECLYGPLDCVGHVKWTFPASISSNITIAASVYDAATALPLRGATARLCAVTDPFCNGPIGVARPGGSDGVAVMMVETAGRGFPSPMFLEVRQPGYLDYILMLDTPPIFADLNVSVALETATAFNSIAQGLGVAYDPTRPVVRGVVNDCAGDDVASTDVQLEVGGDGETAAAFTTEPGQFVVVNVIVPQGSSFLALLRASGQEISSGSFAMRPGALTRVVIAPRP